MFKMAHIGDIAHVAHLIPQVTQIAEQNIESDCRACMAQVCVAIYSRPTHIHAHMTFMDRLERLFEACERIVKGKVILHYYYISLSAATSGRRFEAYVRPAPDEGSRPGVYQLLPMPGFLPPRGWISPNCASYFFTLSVMANMSCFAFSGLMITRLTTGA